MIYIVDDEIRIANLLSDYLIAAGFQTHTINNGSDVLPSIEKNKPDLILLDIMLPGIDGLTLCQEIKSKYDIPIILISAKSEEVDRILGLEIGADDYICKPFDSIREVVARVKARLREPNIQESFKGLKIDEDKKLVWLDDQKVDLTPVEYRLLHTLSQNVGYPVSREKLLDNLYEDKRVVSDRTVDSHVKNLRKKLMEIRNQEDIIKGVYGRGYQFGE